MRLLSNVSDEEEARLIPRTPVLVGYRGSHSHGTYVPPEDETGADDIDIITAYIPSIDHYFGTEGQKWAGKDVKIREWDGVAYEYQHFVHLLEHCNPNVISALWLMPDHYLLVQPAGHVLIDNRNLFSSKLAGKSFGGYAYSQLRRMTAFKDSGASECGCEGTFHVEQCPLRAERGRGSAKLYATGFMGAKRKALVEKFGFDGKNASHLIRLLRMGTEFLATGELRVWREDAAELVGIKRGEWSLERVRKVADEEFLFFREAEKNSPLPEVPDFERINKLVVETLTGFHGMSAGR